MGKKTRLFARLVLVLYIAALAWLCFGDFSDVQDVPKTVFGLEIDKIVHFLMFFPFPFLVFFSFGRRGEKAWKAILWTVVVFAVGCTLAGVTEIVQGELGYRTADVMDFRADGLSLAIASLITFILRIL